jgi:iron(III) transport system substrate-binding protein
MAYQVRFQAPRRFTAIASAFSLLWATEAQAAPPDYYPADYNQIIEASKSENAVLVYSDFGEAQWRPLIEAFNKEYPWIKVSTLDLGSSEAFERYYAESGTGNPTAELLVSTMGSTWLDYTDKNVTSDYQTPEIEHLPDWTRPAAGIYTISMDPLLNIYNKLLLPEDKVPHTVEDIVTLVKADPTAYTKKIVTYVPMTNPANRYFLTTYIDSVGQTNAIEQFKTLSPVLELQRSVGTMIEGMLTGQYLMAFFASGAAAFNNLKDPAKAAVLGWNFPKRGLVILTRFISMPKTAKNMNSAKLLLDFMLSKSGAIALASGGFMPYRADVPPEYGPAGYSYGRMVAELGEEGIILPKFERTLLVPSEELVKQVRDAFGVAK